LRPTAATILWLSFIFVGDHGQALRGNVINGLWTAFIGWFSKCSRSSSQQQMVQGLMVRPQGISGDGRCMHSCTGRHFITKTSRSGGSGTRSTVLLVDRGDRVVGLLTLHNLNEEIPRPSWTTTSAAQAMVPIEKLSSIDPSAELVDSDGKMGRDGINQNACDRGETTSSECSRGATSLNYLQTLQQVGT